MINPAASRHQATNDFVFRAADRMRIDGCANAVASEGMSLALHSEHEALLDHYLELLLTRLRQQSPEHRIEVYFPTNTDSLLGRFNDVLARQSLEQATRAPAAASQAQIWIVHDAQALPDSEIQMLARLIQNFPGANIRTILLMTGKPLQANSLSAFGRKILRWDIEAPNEDQAQAALAQAKADGRLLTVQQLLQRIRRHGWTDNDITSAQTSAHFAPLPEEAPQPKPVGPLSKHLQGFHNEGQTAISQATTRLRQWRSKHLHLGLWVLLGLTLSTLIMLWIQPQAFGITALNKPSRPAEPPLTWPLPGAATTAATPNSAPTANPDPISASPAREPAANPAANQPGIADPTPSRKTP
jgi:hypothetical protein